MSGESDGQHHLLKVWNKERFTRQLEATPYTDSDARRWPGLNLAVSGSPLQAFGWRRSYD